MLGMLIPGAPLPLVVLPLANIFSSFQDFRFGSRRSGGFLRGANAITSKRGSEGAFVDDDGFSRRAAEALRKIGSVILYQGNAVEEHARSKLPFTRFYRKAAEFTGVLKRNRRRY